MPVLQLTKRNFRTLDIDNFRILYKMFVQPQKEYCVQVWSPYLAKHIQLLEQVQHHATKLVTSLKKKSYDDRLRIVGLTL